MSRVALRPGMVVKHNSYYDEEREPSFWVVLARADRPVDQHGKAIAKADKVDGVALLCYNPADGFDFGWMPRLWDIDSANGDDVDDRYEILL